MQIIKTEKILFSECETKSIDMTISLMDNIVRCAEDPELVKIANAAYEKLAELYDYVEEVK